MSRESDKVSFGLKSIELIEDEIIKAWTRVDWTYKSRNLKWTFKQSTSGNMDPVSPTIENWAVQNIILEKYSGDAESRQIQNGMHVI